SVVNVASRDRMSRSSSCSEFRLETTTAIGKWPPCSRWWRRRVDLPTPSAPPTIVRGRSLSTDDVITVCIYSPPVVSCVTHDATPEGCVAVALSLHWLKGHRAAVLSLVLLERSDAGRHLEHGRERREAHRLHQ